MGKIMELFFNVFLYLSSKKKCKVPDIQLSEFLIFDLKFLYFLQTLICSGDLKTYFKKNYK
ncbi:hypothetical protein BpHYR1_008593 [Brachionus plicatilis]|uniref:Uncharacterized protein n=1 Tax=Brachionus plicatilis TaxID=10195 RepID=A0A3M7PM21_BRAPC|nr:hypothetical protein BpHYR1_008593 [Brachionus plicatilis]